jgi:uncharacterized iron-regulated membrane protein
VQHITVGFRAFGDAMAQSGWNYIKLLHSDILMKNVIDYLVSLMASLKHPLTIKFARKSLNWTES